MAAKDFDQYMQVIMHEMVAEGAVLIAPRPGEFGRFEGSFIDGLRRVPAVIDGPPGRDPFAYAMGRPGRWLFLFLPERTS
jgi:hypothetical protein